MYDRFRIKQEPNEQVHAYTLSARPLSSRTLLSRDKRIPASTFTVLSSTFTWL